MPKQTATPVAAHLLCAQAFHLEPVPLLVAQGTNDDIIHCLGPSGTADGAVPGPADCMSRALYDSLADTYCASGVPESHLELNTFRKVDLRSPGTHFSIPGQISAKGGSTAEADLVFDGSPLQEFLAAAVDRSSAPDCSMRVLNSAE